MRKIIFLSSLLAFLFTSPIWAADISGTWVLKYTGHNGDERQLDMVIAAEDENLTVSTTHPSLGEMSGTGLLKENDITMTLTAIGERKISFEMTGTVAGDKMSGTREVKMPERDEKEGAQGGDRGNAPRGARGDASGNAQAKADADASKKAPGGDASKSKETSNTWTAEKK